MKMCGKSTWESTSGSDAVSSRDIMKHATAQAQPASDADATAAAVDPAAAAVTLELNAKPSLLKKTLLEKADDQGRRHPLRTVDGDGINSTHRTKVPTRRRYGFRRDGQRGRRQRLGSASGSTTTTMSTSRPAGCHLFAARSSERAAAPEPALRDRQLASALVDRSTTMVTSRRRSKSCSSCSGRTAGCNDLSSASSTCRISSRALAP
jgi:hypothetical protein